MTTFALFSFLGLVLTACTHAPGGFGVQRSSDTYQLFVGGAVDQKENSFYQAAYDICRTRHKSGFEVTNRSYDSYDSIEANVTCKGAVDPFLAQRYRGKIDQIEKSDLKYDGGFRYKVIFSSAE